MVCLRAPIRMNSGTPEIIYSYIADSEAERPSTAIIGEDCYCKDTKKTYTCTAAGPTWEQTGGSGGQGAATPQFMVPVIVNAITYTNAPVGGLEPAGQQSRVQLDLRSTVNVVGQALFSVVPSAAGVLRFEYSTNGGGAWSTLLDMGASYTLNVLKISAATAVPAGAKIVNALIRVVVTGDGVVDPVVQKAQLMFQPS